MSLTSFLKIKDVKEAFKQFKKPPFKIQAELLAPPLTNHYSLVGTAFDYLLRFYIKRMNPNAIEKEWISEVALRGLEATLPPESKLSPELLRKVITEDSAKSVLHDVAIYKKVKGIVEAARRVYSKYVKDGIMSSDLFRAVLLLAQVDVIYRADFVDKNLGNVDQGDIKDLRNLISIVKPEYFKAREMCLLNPTFGEASRLVGGADCDLIIDDAIIDIKTTKKPELIRGYFDQLIGYYTLQKIGGIDGMPSNRGIKRLGIYFSRYAYLYFVNVRDIIREDTFPNFIEWFKKRASLEYGSHI